MISVKEQEKEKRDTHYIPTTHSAVVLPPAPAVPSLLSLISCPPKLTPAAIATTITANESEKPEVVVKPLTKQERKKERRRRKAQEFQQLYRSSSKSEIEKMGGAEREKAAKWVKKKW